MIVHDEKFWPALPLQEWQDTYSTLHMWTQIVGKIRLTKTPLINHWWNSTLYVSARGLTTSAIPHEHENFQIDFDFVDHQLIIQKSDGLTRTLDLRPRTVADFYRELMATLKSMNIEVAIHATPDEVQNPIPFAEDHVHTSYDREYVNRFFRILIQVNRVFNEFRSRFIGKCSPVHFFWGGFDLAVSRFTGRRAPERSGADGVQREAYSHEVISAGFWCGGGAITAPAFYSYTAPVLKGLSSAKVQPPGFYHQEMGEFLLMYDEVRNASSPEAMLLDFLQSTYEAGIRLIPVDRTALER